VRVVEALADLHHGVASHGDRIGLAALAGPIEDRAQVLALHVLERDEVAVADFTELEDLGDVRVGQLNRDLRLVDEHRDELVVLGDDGRMRLTATALEALHTEGLALKTSAMPPTFTRSRSRYFPKGMGFFTAFLPC
jgi:hypothetical protein